MKRIALVIALLCCATSCFSSFAQSPAEDVTVLMQDSGVDINKMNITFTGLPTLGAAQVVKFTAPKTDWTLESVLVMATDGWNASNEQLPLPLPFSIEIRDADLRLLYHFSDTQYPYFTTDEGVRMANIEIPALIINGDFFVCFYGYGSLGLAAELQNATDSSYIFDKPIGQLYSGALPIGDNQTLPVNWIIRAAGE
ncbi:MAG: hypothetical protein ACP5OU_03480 [Methanothrix sp.]